MKRAPATGAPTENDPDLLVPAARLAGRPLLLLLDVDGTLAPIAPLPTLAHVPPGTRSLIAALAATPGVTVGLVSGRAAQDARRLVGVAGVWTVGNHGAEIIAPNGAVTVDTEVSRYAESMARTAQTLEPLLSPMAGVILENKTWTLSVHYRAADERVVPRLRSVVERVATEHGLRVTEGKKVLEIRPPIRVDKGTAIERLVQDLGALSGDASVLFAGDDVTDEDAFRFLRQNHPRAVTIHIGEGIDTAAEFTFPTTEQLRALLERVARTAGASQ